MAFLEVKGIKVFKLTNFLVEDFVKSQFVSLFQVFLHHTANAANMKGGEGEKKRIGLIFTVVIRSLRRIRREPTLKDYVSVLPRLLSVIPARVWASPCHLSPSIQTTGRPKHRGGCSGAGEKHASLGTGANENETGENKSISTPHTGLLTPRQHHPYTRGQEASPAVVHASTSLCKKHLSYTICVVL